MGYPHKDAGGPYFFMEAAMIFRCHGGRKPKK